MGMLRVAQYNFDDATLGLVDACRTALGERASAAACTVASNTGDPRAQGQP